MKTYHECKLDDGKITFCTECVNKLSDGGVLFEGCPDGEIRGSDILTCKSIDNGPCAACEEE